MIPYFTTVRMTVIEKRESTGVGKDVAIRECLYTVGGDTQMGSAATENIMENPQKLRIDLPLIQQSQLWVYIQWKLK